jgi:hypothetical protein
MIDPTKSFIGLILCLILLLGCTSQLEKELFGEWQLVQWLNESTGNQREGEVRFKFSEDKRYMAELNGIQEKGEYWVEFQNLHTVEDGKVEKKVKILKLENDTLVLEMNRMGTLEKMVLVKI